MATGNDKDFTSQCDAAFASINRKCLGELAYFLHWTMDDVRQEFGLIFWESLSGSGGFDGSKGTLQGYFIGRLKTLLYKRDGFHNFNFIDLDSHDDATPDDALADGGTEKSTLDLLIEREEQQHTCPRHRNGVLFHVRTTPSARPGWVQRLRQQGLTQTQIAEIGGVSQAYVSRALKKSSAGNSTPCSV
jgi:hypothetical protein